MTDGPGRRCVVRLTDGAVDDLRRLHKKDPRIVRAAFTKMLLLERSPDAGEPLLGPLVGFRKLVVGDRDWRIIWRVTRDADGTTVLEVSEVWAVGARADSEVYAELRERLERMGDAPELRPLAAVVASMGRLYESTPVTPEPAPAPDLPPWLQTALRAELHLTDQEIAGLSPLGAQLLLTQHWSRPPSS